MPVTSDERKIRIFCPQHGKSFEARANASIFCEDNKEEHELGRDFPYGDYWQYCCDCDQFYPRTAATKWRIERGMDAAQCSGCGRQAIRHYVCAQCKVVSHKDGKKRGTQYSISATGVMRPFCPGCLEPESAVVSEHECQSLSVTYTTARAVCQFCKKEIAPGGVRKEKQSPPPPAQEETAPTETPPEQKTPAISPPVKRPPPDLPAAPPQFKDDHANSSEDSEPTGLFNERVRYLGFVLCLSVLFFSLGLVGYYFLWLPSHDAEADTPPVIHSTTASVADSPRLQDAQKKLNDLKEAAQKATDKAAKAKEEADAMEARARRNGVEVNDPRSQTAQLRRAQRIAEVEDRQAAEAVFTAERDVQKVMADLKTDRDATPSSEMEDESLPSKFIPSWLLPASAAVVGLFLLGCFCLISWTLYRRQSKTNDDVLRVASKIESSSYKLARALDVLGHVRKSLSLMESDIAKLKDMVREVREKQLADRRWEATSYPAAKLAYSVTPVEEPIEDAVDFPLTVNSLLSRLSGQQQIIKLDPLKGILVKDSDGKGHFLLARDRSIPGGQLYIFPRTAWFRVPEDYYNHYEKFYECRNPAAGEVWVAEPAVVERVDGGWKLREKGILEIK